MEFIRNIISSLAILLLILHGYLILGEKHFNFTFKNYYKIYNLLLLPCFVSSIIGLLLDLMMYNYLDYFLIMSSVWSVILIIASFFKDNEHKILYIKKGTFSVSTEIELIAADFESSYYEAKSYIQTEINNETKYIIFSGIAPKETDSFYVNYTEDRKNPNILIAGTFKNEKTTLSSWLDFIITMSVIVMMVYGYSQATIYGIKNGFPIPEDSPFKFVAIGAAYFIFHFGSRKLRYGTDSFTKFWYFVSLICYIIVLVVYIAMLFGY